MDASCNEDVRKHAWDWFALHAAQRMQTVNFFIVIEAALLAGIGVAFKEDLPAMVSVLGLSITVLAFVFGLIERRVRKLVRIGEAALRVEQARLASQSGIPEIQMCDLADNEARQQLTYGKLFAIMFWFFGLLGCGFAATGVWLLMCWRP